ncbi:MAG: mycothiol S-conjugate amidase [Frankiaceae bacterium]|jgi:mycothiol S-conjugate amidase|nr:mycothiol S-conjugate amidase [Frankiaceae bacterium]
MPDGERLRLMAVHAHPDDESSKGAATMARYAREGVDVLVVTCTGGEAGDILNPAMDRPEIVADLPAVRRRELVTAINILAVRQVDLGFVDSGLPQKPEDAPENFELPPLDPHCFARQPLDVTGRALVEIVRRERPHVVVTYDENGGYPHPDHIACHLISVEAFDAAGDPERYPDAGEPWQPSKLYYVHGWHKEKLVAIHEAMLARGLESPYAERLATWEDKPEDRDRITTRVQCGEFFELRNAALLAHATQVDPDGPWFHVPLDLQRECWPTEDYELARSMVDTTMPEDDLFAGLREPSRTG